MTEKTIESQYEKYKDFGNQVYQEYESAYMIMFSKVNESHLEIFANILKDHENILLKGRDDLVKSMRHNLEKQMLEALLNVWISNNVSEHLMSLEICKDKFKLYEGQKWNLDEKTPKELTRPIRICLKESRLNYIKKQLDYQNERMDEVLKENQILRQNFLDVKHQRAFLIENIENFRKKIELAKIKIMELKLKLFTENSENIEFNIKK